MTTPSSPSPSSPSSSSQLHVVLGAGQIGPLVAARLHALGHRVRLVRRGRFGAELPTGVEPVNADVLDPDGLARATAGADALYHCVNPPYTAWAKDLLPMTRAIVGAAERAGAHLVVLDNLYMYGRAPGGVMREDTAVAPCSRKGALRAEAAELMLAARTRGVAVTIGRASDFIGPGAVLAAVFGERFWPRALAGKAVEVLGDPSTPHAYSYTLDVADGLVTLGTDPRARDQLWHLPANPAVPTAALIAEVARVLGHPLPIRQVPRWLLRSLGVVWPLAREVAEMTYQWDDRFEVDDRRFRTTFGRAATPWPEALAATIAWARSAG